MLLDADLARDPRRTAALSAELAQGQRLSRPRRRRARRAGAQPRQSRARRQQFAALEQRALAAGARSRRRRRSARATSRSPPAKMSSVCAAREASSQSLPRGRRRSLPATSRRRARPFAGGRQRFRRRFAYQLPAAAPVTEGLGSVNAERRSLARAHARHRRAAPPVTAPADGTIRFAGPFRDYDGILIIDHGGGWMSLIVNVASTLQPATRSALGAAARPRARAAAGRIVPEWASNLACSHRRFISNPVKGPQRRLNRLSKPRYRTRLS